MAQKKSTMTLGSRIYGLGIMALGLVGLTWGNFVLGQPVPKNFPHRAALAYAAGAFLLLAGAAIEWRRTATVAAAALTAYYALIVVILMNGRILLTHYAEYGTYSGIAEQLGITASALILFATSAKMNAPQAKRLKRLAHVAFGICALLFGGAHFVYMNLTAPLIPKWLPPTQHFWACATGIGFLAAGVAILTRVQARLAAILLTAMLASFTLLVHGPMLLANHSSRMNWTEGAINLALVGAAWIVAESLPLNQ